MKIPGILLSLAFGLTVHAQQTSENNPRLRNALESHPEADADKDGVLTLEEAKAYKNRKQADDPAEGKEHGNGIRSSHVYKTVGNDKLELFVDAPKGHTRDAKVPAIVFFHGGGFRSGSVDQFERQAEYLAGRGMVTIRVRYRLTKEPGVEVTDCIEDAISAMRWVRANAGKLGIDPERIAAGGGSAGGYLSAATLLIEHINAKTDPEGVSAKPNALVLYNPGFGRPGNEGAVNPEDPEGKGDLKRYVKSGLPPMIQFFGTEDPFLPIARPFIDAYTKAGNRCDLVTYEGEGHSFFNKDKYLGPTISETDKFLTGIGWLGKKEDDE
jgi:acetyl esterase/lipase